MSGSIFISYRRDDSEGEAGRLYDDLIRVFGPDAVFMDVSDIHPGKDFRQAIDDNVAGCAVLLAIIGPGWTTVKDATGARRLDQPTDFVRLEIASALGRGIDVIPVLVHGAHMPAPAELPEVLQNLAYRNCVEVTHVRWNSDVELLSRSLRTYLLRGNAPPTRVIHKAITGENIAVAATETQISDEKLAPAPAQARSRLLPTVSSFVLMLAAAVLGAVSYSYIHRQFRNHEKKVAESSQPSRVQAAGSTPSVADGASSASSSQSPATAPATNQAAPASTPDHQHLQALSGTWINAQAPNGKPMRVQIADAGLSASIHLWIRCGTSSCDAGTKSLALSGDGISTQWTGQFSSVGNEQIDAQTVNMRIYRIGNNLHMIFSTQTGSTGFDFIRD